ncbi:MAG: electron transfer flavoprotein subunit beta/FixA family protein [Chloroflexi bacterium]|nr:electron transfer flavoprotein subunit beta/FixA family protein [Chloroflexota bacterium]
MKIVVCVKYALDVSEVKLDPATKKPRLLGVPKKISDVEKNALEAAAQLKEKYGGTIHILTFGPLEAKEAFREALAMNADGAILVEDPCDGQLDAQATVKVLAAAVKKLSGVDLVVCGEASDDGFTYQVGPRLAERLGIPQITYARALSIEDGSVVAKRHLEDCAEIVKAPLPALITVTEETNIPRKPTLMDMLKAKNKKVELWKTEEDLGLSRGTLEELSALQTLDIEGIEVQRKQFLIKGKSPTDAAEELIALLLQEGVLGVAAYV